MASVLPVNLMIMKGQVDDRDHLRVEVVKDKDNIRANKLVERQILIVLHVANAYGI